MMVFKKKTVIAVAQEWKSPYAKLATLKKKYMEMKLLNKDDETGYALIKDGVNEMVSLRTGLEKKRKEINRTVNAEGARLLALIAPIEEHLKSQKAIRDNWLQAEKQRKADEEKQRIADENARLEEENAAKDKELADLRKQLAEKNQAEELFAPSPVEKEQDIAEVVEEALRGNNSAVFATASPNIDKVVEMYDTLRKIVAQLERCNYHNEAGLLINNVAFIALKKIAENS